MTIVEQYSNKRRNRSTLYLFPMLYDEFNIMASNVINEENGFKMINVYVGDKEKPDYSNHLLMLIKISDFENINFKIFLENLKNNKLYREYYNVDFGYIMLVFEMGDEELEIINHFIKGEYSKFPEIYKNYFPVDFNTNIKCQYNILTQNKLLRHKIEQDLNVSLDQNSELDDKPYLEEEIFRYE